MMSKKKKLFVVVFCATVLLLVFSLSQMALWISYGWTFKCQQGCDYCACKADYAVVASGCCGMCVGTDDGVYGGVIETVQYCCTECPSW